jgi:hypothetical protein
MSDYISPYLSGREKNFKIGISSYTEDKTVLEVTGKVGIGTTNATSSLYVVGDEYVTGVVTATTFYGTFSGNATTATYATSAGIATYAHNAGIATYAHNAGIATYAHNAGIATYAHNAGIATYAHNAGIATYAHNAGIATYAHNAGIATYAHNAGIATYATIAGYSTSSGIATYAHNAGIATYATIAGYSTSSGIATYAPNAGIATYAPNAGIATYAPNAGIATYAPNAGIATYAPNAGIATYAPNAGIATYAPNAGIATYATIAGIATYAPNAGIATYAPNAGIATYAPNAGIATYAPNAGIATEATRLQNARTFEITGDVVASAISFDGTGNVSLAATIQPNSVALGSDTTGDYVQSISGTANQITVTGGTGESSTPVISIPSNPILPGNVTIANDLQVNNNLNVNGNITIGGTTAYILVDSFRVSDADIILGFTTNSSNQDASNDTTANHGGIAVASTEGTPLVNFNIAGIETLPPTYKKIMWFKAGAFAGLGTDAWLSNYAIGIGSTQVPNGVRLAVGGVHVTDDTVTATTFVGSLTGTATSTTNIPNLTGDVTSNNTVTTLATVNNNVGTYGDAGAIPRVTVNAKGLVTGVTTVAPNDGQLSLGVSGTGLSGSATFTANQSGPSTFTVTSNATDVNTPSTIVARDASGNFSAGTLTANLTGTATTATNLANAANITTGTINSARLSGTYSIDISGNAATATYAPNAGIATYAPNAGIATYAPNAGIATYAPNAGIATYAPNAGIATYADSSGISTYAPNAGIATNVIGGIASVTQLSVSGFSTVGVLTATSIGIGTTNPTSALWVGGDGYFVGVVSASNFYVGGNVIGGGSISGADIVGTALSISGISTLGTVKISSGIVTATTGIVTYYGDGQYLNGVIGFAVNLQDPVSEPVYPMFANNTGVTSAGISTTQLVFIPSSGNLGVGSTQPASKLTVQGDVKVSGVVTATTFYGSAAGLTNIPPAPGEINVTDISENATYYPTFAVGTGDTTALNTITTKLTFNPSTSVLTVKGTPYFGDTVSSITLTNPLAVFTSNVDGYSQVQAQNLFAGGSSSASVDFVATTDSGTDTAEYIDMGINNSGFTAAGLWSAKDGYLYVQAPTAGNGGNLVVGTSGAAGRDIILHTGGTATTNERVRISDTKVTIQDNVEVTSGSIYGKVLAASYGMFMP